MLNIHTCLWNDVDEFHFKPGDFAGLRALPSVSVTVHETAESFLADAAEADLVLTWDFASEWYAHCPRLKLVMTPAAGTDWVEPDPSGKVQVKHGTFHGDQ